MCGITGAIWWQNERAVSAQTLQRMTDSIRHRGPDADGHYFRPADNTASTSLGVALGHRRLSIIDVAGSAQPLSNEDDQIQIVFNGEIYNYQELRPDLIARGHQFRTDGDTEVIVHLYEEYGLNFVQYLRGMFAIAIWDARHRRLVLVRDRLGQKPLFYRLESGRLSFASELKSLLQIPDMPRELDRMSVLRFLTLQYVPHPHCILQGFNKLPPSTIGVLQDGQLNLQTYWSPPYDQPQLHRAKIADWQDELRDTLTEAVRLRLRSDVPLGAFLSGGIDSTVICGLMQKQLDRPVQTFSIGFPIAAFDERSYARQASQMLGTDHHEAVVEPDAIEMLPRLVWHYDEPFGDSSSIPTMYLSKMTRENVTVALTGDAGDELFCGYDRYKAARIAGLTDRLPSWVRHIWNSRLVAAIPTSVEQKSFRRRLKRLLETLGQEPERRYLNWITIFNSARLQWLVSEDMRHLLNEQEPAECIFDAYGRYPNRDFITRTTATDLHTYLPCDILTKVDIASMAVGLEARSPMLDHKVVELAATMPIEVKQSVQRGKMVLTDTFADLIPADIQTRRKMGFGVPIDHWFRNELKDLLHDILLSDRCLQRGLLNPDSVRQLVSEHTSGQVDHAYRLWNLLCLEIWQRMYLDSVPPTEAPNALP
ncbi:MAG: asparagine synthase (glutamine-hydrolyzing) [Planctomycetaceae bacterium]|nr:asparagine synthase (glutamine-hydrolyzing) [Planctomycetaceae bacterium]